MKKVITISMLTLAAVAALAGSLTGTVKESTGSTLPNARVSILNTTYQTMANVDGVYSFKNLPDGTYRVQVAFTGFASETQSVTVAGETTLDFTLEPSNIEEAVIVTANRAVVRETPVAFSNVSGEQIRARYTTQDTPDLVKSVPGVFTRSAGLGESDLYVRGFDSERVQIMINNVPVNDPESQVVYWSNWTGLSGNAADIQVQRGVGSSLYGSGAFGGSVNIETDNFSVDRHIGLLGTYGFANSDNSNYIGAIDYSTGFFNNDRSNIYFRYERKAGDSYIDGTNYDGHSFYLGFMHYISDNQTLKINFHGAPQEHNQAANVQDPELLEQFGRTWNRRNHPYQENYYFKPVFEVHHDWTIDSQSHVRTTFFATTGNGGGRYLRNDHVNMDTGAIEPIALSYDAFSDPTRDYTTNRIYGNSWRNDSQNKHKQYGFNTSYKNILNDFFTVIAGGEYRQWNAEHFSDAENFQFYNEADPGNPIVVDNVEQRYNYDGDVTSYSLFARGQFSPTENLDIMLDLAWQHYDQEVDENPLRQYDFYNRTWTDIYARSTMDILSNWDASSGVATADVVANPAANPDNYSRTYDFVAPKFGINWNITEAWNMFFNYSQAKKEPKVGDWYPRSRVPLSEDELKEESLTNAEIGVGYRTRNHHLAVNIYQMEFEDKIEYVTDSLGERTTMNAGNADHEGIELSYNWAINRNFRFSSSWTFANNEWTDMNVQEIFGFDVEDVVGKHVPGAPEFMTYNELYYSSDTWYGFLSHYRFDDYYVLYDNSALTGLEDDGTLGTCDETNLGVGYKMDLGGNTLDLAVRAYNIFDNEHWYGASWGRDYGRDGQYHLGVLQAPKFNWYMTANYRF